MKLSLVESDEPANNKRHVKEKQTVSKLNINDLVNDTVVVLGHPYAKERGRINPKTGRIYTPSNTVRYQKLVMRSCFDHKLRLEPNLLYQLEGHIYVTAKHGDVTNIIKSIEDGVNQYAQRVGIDWDDKQIVRIGIIKLEVVKRREDEKVIFTLRPIE
jgi:Holliday junction resolvase RusA-like endonuclease